MEDTQTNENNYTILELGDIIEILSPTNNNYHEKRFIIKYIDTEYMEVLNIYLNETYKITFDDVYLSDESITQINLLSRSEDKGFALQNNILPKKWINIHFQGDLPIILTGEITNLENDMIEIMTYPDKKMIYIDFAYKGIPNHIPIEKIIIRQKPLSFSSNIQNTEEQDQREIQDEIILEEGEIYQPEYDRNQNQTTIEFTDNNESIINIPENNVIDENIIENLNKLYANSNIIYGEETDNVRQVVELSEDEQRYSIEIQTNDLLDELLSDIPNYQRNQNVMIKIHKLIERYKELREEFSVFDDSHNAYSYKQHFAYHKPLINILSNMNKEVSWFIPVVKNLKTIYANNSEELLENGLDYSSVENNLFGQIREIQRGYRSDEHTFLRKEVLINELLNPINNDNSDCIINMKVNSNIDTIIDNLDDFYSSVKDNDEIKRKQYVIQRYNLSNQYTKEELLKSGKKIYKKVNVNDNDEICIKSLLMLPYSIMNYSTINLPGTNIINKSNLHNNPLYLFKLLNKNTNIIPHYIDDLSKEYQYDNHDMFNNFNEFTLNKDIKNEDKYNQFLNSIVPKTKDIITHINKYNNKFSLYDYVRLLEPFNINTSDLTYKQYVSIRINISEKIKEYRKNYDTKYNKFVEIQKSMLHNTVKKNNILHLINEQVNDITNAFFKNYNLLIKNKQVQSSSQETLNNMINVDNGKLYTKILSSVLSSLVIPENILNMMAEPDIDDYSKITNKDCSTRYLTKKYTSIDKLLIDNDVDELYYDEEYDDTPYEILNVKEVASANGSMSKEVFLSYLKETLIEKHNTSKETAEQLAKTLILNKKMIQDGEYAILELKPTSEFKDIKNSELNEDEKHQLLLHLEFKTKKIYYKRINNTWVKDDVINDIDFIDTNTIFCNLKDKCIKNNKNNICESTNESLNRNTEYTNKDLLNEFNKRYTFTFEELNEKIQKDVELLLKKLKKINILKEVQNTKHNNLIYELSKFSSDADILISPKKSILDKINGQSDFGKKQQDICKFYDKYCREPLETLNESSYWKYCIETNTKLLQNTIYQLAIIFTTNRDNYNDELQKICKIHGAIDGNKIVDKNTGVTLKYDDYSVDEGYDEEGRKVTSRSILDADLGNSIMSTEKEKKIEIFENETNGLIYKILSRLCDMSKIDINLIKDFVLRISNVIIQKKIADKDEFYSKKDKTKDYDKYKNEYIILIVSSVFLISVQTAMPSLSSSRTVYSCIKSYNGFPLTGVEDLSSIEYIGCMLNKLNTQTEPWDSIRKIKQDKLSLKLKNIIDYIITLDDIKDLYDRKKTYLSINPDVNIPSEYSIQKWVLFNPPLVKYSILKRLQNINSSFEKNLIEFFKKGDNKQFANIEVLKLKQREISYGIIETIRNIVKEKELILKTSGLIPFVENACCNEKLSNINPIFYFNNIDNSILHNIKSIISNSKILKDIRLLSTPPFFYHNKPTNIIYPTIPEGIIQDNIYHTIIHYCNFDKDLPIPNYLEEICNQKPDKYISSWNIQEKIDFFKRNGKQYTLTDYYRLINIINKRNQVIINKSVEFNQINAFADILDKLDTQNESFMDPPLINLLKTLLTDYNPKAITNIYSDNLKNLINYLDKSNTKILKEITKFFKSNSNKYSEPQYKKTINFLKDINKWNLEDNNNNNSCHHENLGLHKFINFTKKILYSLSKVYLTCITEKNSFNKTSPKHWDFSDNHYLKLDEFHNNYYKNLKKYSNDPIIINILNQLQHNLKDVYYFTQSIPIYSELIHKDSDHKFHCLFDKQSLYLLYTHCIYSVIYEFIKLTDDPNLLHIAVMEHKKDKEEAKQNISDLTYEAEINSIVEIQIEQGTKIDLKQKINSLLFSILNIELDNKKLLNKTYEEIVKQTNRSREMEKDAIFDYFNSMEDKDERKLEKKLKKYKLGRWDIGLQSRIFKYDKKTNDNDGFEHFNDNDIDIDNDNDNDNDNDTANDNDIDNDNDIMDDANAVDEQFNINNLGNNYTDGNYYKEDQEFDD